MGKRRITVLALCTALVLLVALLGSTFSAWMNDGPTPIVLPETPSTFAPVEDQSTTPSLGNEAVLQQVTITPENVQAVLATLVRPEHYTADLKLVRSYYGQNAVTLRKVMRRDDLLSCVFYSGDGTQKKTVVTDGETIWSWLVGSSVVHTFPIGSAGYDSLVNVPSYEDLLSADPGDITAASYTVVEDQDCISVTLFDPETDYEDTYHISITTGLLLRYQREKNGEQRLLLQMTGFDPASPEDSVFTLPSGEFPE